MASSESDKCALLDRLAEEFAERFRRGERPSLKEYLDNYPELANDIRALFPAMVEIERAEGNRQEFSTAPPADECLPHRIDDYVILRTVGRGGMGVVYEAEQVSLGRRVALKVLPEKELPDDRVRRRFEREAKAAAKLHHTNIVPVFGFGEHDGRPYYVMQFIEGLGLNDVLDELKRLQVTQGDVELTAGSAGQEHVSVFDLTRSLLASEFAPERRPLPRQVSTVDRSPPTVTGGDAPSPEDSGTAPESSSPSGPISLPGQQPHDGGKATNYWRSMAQVALQVAEALEYAHSQGVLHRDIKPSNLLLDTRGTVWVADFGLAKANDQQDLTQTGDVLGTLRYMPPEAFEGKADARSDVYSLGLTLYELLTLKPAFDARDRPRLIKKVTEGTPAPLRQLRPEAPRDLETIVHKAIERDPSQRYQSPAEFAEDLRRFVEDRPIRARRTSASERFWRWCRRNPAIASLAGAVQVALVGLIVLGAWSNYRISQALRDKDQAIDEKDNALLDKDKALNDKVRALADTESARREAVRLSEIAVAETYRSLRSEVQALRLSHNSGWRQQALQKIRGLIALETPQRNFAELRGDAIACLGEFDAHMTARFQGHTSGVWSLDFSPDGSTLATAGYDGWLRLWDVQENREVHGQFDHLVNGTIRHHYGAPLPAVRFCPDGGFLAVAMWNYRVGLFDWGDKKAPNIRVQSPGQPRYLAFDRKGSLMAVSWGHGEATVHEAASGQIRFTAQTVRAEYLPVALHPDGTILASTGPGNTVQLHRIEDKNPPVILGSHRDNIRSLCFSPSGHLLASASADSTIKLWPVKGDHDPIVLLGHTARVQCVAFSPDGSLIATASDDESVRIWETKTGQVVMVLQPAIGPLLSVAFSPDGTQLATGCVDVALYRLTIRQTKQMLVGHGYFVPGISFHPRKTELASSCADGEVILWDVEAGQPRVRLHHRKNIRASRAVYSPDGQFLAVSYGGYSAGGPVRQDYSVQVLDSDTGAVRKQLNGPATSVNALAFELDSKMLAAGCGDGTIHFWDMANGDRIHSRRASQKPISKLAFLRDGTLIAAENAGDLLIQPTNRSEKARRVNVPGGANNLVVSPDEHDLVVGCVDGSIRIVTVAQFSPRAVTNAHDGPVTAVALAADGQLLASGGVDRKVILWDARTLERLYTLPQPSPVENLAFDADGLRLAISGRGHAITVWNFAMIRPELAALALDWDARSLPPPKKQADLLTQMQPSSTIKVVRASTTTPPLGGRPSNTSEIGELETLYRQGRFAEIIPKAEKSLETDARDKQVYLVLARARYRLGQVSKAKVAAQSHLDLCQNCSAATQLLANCHLAMNDPNDAVKLLEHLLEIHPELDEISNQLAYLQTSGFQTLRNPERALTLAQRALTHSPGNANFRTSLGIAYFRLGKIESCVQVLQSASPQHLTPDSAVRNRLFLAMAYHRLGDHAKSKLYLDQANDRFRSANFDPHIKQELHLTQREAARLLGNKK